MTQRGWMAVVALAAAASSAKASDATLGADLDSATVLEHFLAEFGPGLVVNYDYDTGYPQDIFGMPMDLGWVPSTDAQFEQAARNIVEAYSPLFGYGNDVLEVEAVRRLELSRIGTTDKVAVCFNQVVDGMPVRSGGLAMIFLEHNGALVSISNYGIPNVASLALEPAIDEDRAIELAEAAFPHAVEQLLSLDIAIVDNALKTGPALAWQVELRAVDRPGGIPVQLKYDIDAHSGDLIRTEKTVHTVDVIGRVKGWGSPGTSPYTSSNSVLIDLDTADYDSPVGDDDSNRKGYTRIPYGGTSVQTVTLDFASDSTWAYIVSATSGELSKSKDATPGNRISGRIIHNQAKKEKKTAQINAHVQTARLIRWMKDTFNDSTGDFRHRLNTNIDSCCNAYYDGFSTNYFIACSGCSNTAYSSIIQHEIGHHLNDLYNSGNGSDGFGEGNADNFATHVNDDPIVGRNFCGSGCHIRNANNNRQYCNNSCGSGCYGGVHTDGEVLMGAMWKVRTRLNNSHGNAGGDLISDTLLLGWMNAYNDGAICTGIRDHYLVLDDDDGNINNGTPNGTDIDNGFKQQGFPGFY